MYLQSKLLKNKANNTKICDIFIIILYMYSLLCSEWGIIEKVLFCSIWWWTLKKLEIRIYRFLHWNSSNISKQMITKWSKQVHVHVHVCTNKEQWIDATANTVFLHKNDENRRQTSFRSPYKYTGSRNQKSHTNDGFWADDINVYLTNYDVPCKGHLKLWSTFVKL